MDPNKDEITNTASENNLDWTGTYSITCIVNYNTPATAYYELTLVQEGLKITGTCQLPIQSIWTIPYTGTFIGFLPTPDAEEVELNATWVPGNSGSKIYIHFDDDKKLTLSGHHKSITDNSTGTYFGVRK